VWEATSGKIISTHKSNNIFPIHVVVWPPDGKIKMVTGGGGSWAYIVDITSGKEILCTPSVSNMYYATDSFALSRDGRFFASAENSSTYEHDIKQGVYPWLVKVIDATSGELIFSGEKHVDFVRTVTLSPDNKYLASGSVDKTIRIWSLATGENVFMYRGHTSEINTLAWSPDSKRIASSSLWENEVYVWQAT